MKPEPVLVLMEWEDSAQPIPGWAFLEDFDNFSIIRCRSVGWLIHDGEVKALAQNMGASSADDDAQISGVIRIPARCVVSVKRLTAS